MKAIALIASVITATLYAGNAHACMADGTWVGTWGQLVPSSVTVKGCKIVGYTYNNRPQRIGQQSISGDTIVMTTQAGQFYFHANGSAQYGGTNGSGVGSFSKQ